MKRMFLIDSLPYVFRSYYALPQIAGPKGENVNAVLGYANFLIKLILQERPDYVLATFDESLTTCFRNEMYPSYKANRVMAPPDLKAQLDYCKDMAEALGCAVAADKRYEADDLIATALKKYAARDKAMRFTIVTTDKDLLQLVNARTRCTPFVKDGVLGPQEVLQKMGVSPRCVPDYLGLMGDSVDNIPGVKGVGPKTAIALLRQYGSLNNLYRSLEKSFGQGNALAPLHKRLLAEKDMALLSKLLATVSIEAPMKFTLRQLAYRGPDRRRILALCRRLGFERLKERALVLCQ